MEPSTYYSSQSGSSVGPSAGPTSHTGISSFRFENNTGIKIKKMGKIKKIELYHGCGKSLNGQQPGYNQVKFEEVNMVKNILLHGIAADMWRIRVILWELNVLVFREGSFKY